jgi:hypothetical protein
MIDDFIIVKDKTTFFNVKTLKYLHMTPSLFNEQNFIYLMVRLFSKSGVNFILRFFLRKQERKRIKTAYTSHHIPSAIKFVATSIKFVMPRGPYTKIGQLDRDRLIRAFDKGRDWLALAVELDIHQNTARSIIATYGLTGRTHSFPRGGDRRSLLNEEMVARLVDYVDRKPTITLLEMRANLLNDFPTRPPVSPCTISRALDGQFISIKDVRAVPFQWNTAEVKSERKGYAQWLLNTGAQENLIFVDEFGCNVWTARTKGRAPIGQRAVRIVEGQRGQNLTLCLAISPQWGLVHWMFVESSFTNQHFVDFLVEVEALVDAPFTLLCDNARPHNNSHLDSQVHQLRYLPRYSPYLNCAEYAGSALKAAVKRSLSELPIQMEMADREQAAHLNQTLHRWRLNILRREMERALPVLTQQKCQHWFNHAMTYMQNCLNQEDIFA